MRSARMRASDSITATTRAGCNAVGLPSHAKYLVFQLAEVAVPRKLFAAIVERIGQLRLGCASG